jgi:predicted  nucleic acid-binding Zn-ribbon protein
MLHFKTPDYDCTIFGLSLYNSSMSQALTLFRLQQIDTQIDRAKSRLDIIEKKLIDTKILDQAIKDAESAATEKSNAENNQSQADDEIRSLRIKIEQTESSLYNGSVRNPKELQDLQNEAAALKRHYVTLEGRLFDAMLIFEESQKEYKRQQSLLSTSQIEFTEQRRILAEEKANLLKDIQNLNTERLAITETLVTEDIHLYENLRHERQGLAVTGIQDNACLACGTTLTLALIQAARSPGQISRCPSCGRILYGS